MHDIPFTSIFATEQFALAVLGRDKITPIERQTQKPEPTLSQMFPV
jgi:hypothetical protein